MKKPQVAWFVVGALAGLLLSAAAISGRLGALTWLPKPPERIVYLAPSAAPELWQVHADGTRAVQLTRTGGNVFDYAIWPDGSQIVYSARNGLGGLDLWLIQANDQARLMLDCGADHCAQAAVNPDGSQVAYSRRSQAENPGGGPSFPRIWLFNTRSGETRALFADARVAGSSPQWRPDGSALVFYNPREGALQVHLLDGNPGLQLHAQSVGPAMFTPDSQSILFAESLAGEERPLGRISRFDFDTQRLLPVLEEERLTNYGAPAVSPRGDWLAVTAQADGEGSARHIWLVRLDGALMTRISEDPQVSQSAGRWDRQGERLIFQQLRLGSSGRTPQVFIWDKAQNRAFLIATDAFLPDWRP